MTDPALIERAAEAIHAQLCKRNGIDFPWASLDPDRREDFCDDARAALSLSAARLSDVTPT
jgi:hypothetical protein